MANRSHKSFFMPMLCRPSINDAVKPAKLSKSSSTTDPSSPKLSCIGQIKKRSTTSTENTTTNINDSNRFLVYRLSASTNAKSSVHSNLGYTNAKSSFHSNLGYTKLHKLFSGKNLSSAAIDTTSINNCSSKCVTKRSKSCNGRARRPISTKKYYMTSSDDQDLMRVVVAEELDPPLPVVKCQRQDADSNVNLCKRRGIEIKTLQIQPIHLRMDHTSAKTF